MDSETRPDRILVVEDDPGHAELLERSFEDAPEFTVRVVDTIKAARDLINDDPPDLVLTDYLLPDGAGKDMLSIIPGGYPVVVMTSHGSEQIAVELMKAGALDYIVKSPDSFGQMPQVVRRALREWRLRRLHEKAQQELAEMNASLEQRVREEVAKNLEKDRILAHQARLSAMGEMLRDIAHQWRQPLNNISLIVQGLGLEYEQGELTSASCRQQVAQCVDILQYLSDTIDLFRTFYQPDYSPQTFQLGEAVESAVSLMRPGIEADGIGLQFEQDAVVEIEGYRNEFVNAVINIINNAREATKDHKPQNPAILINLHRSDTHGMLSIKDNGGGISPDIMDKIFDPYFTTKFKSQGTGIGLYMARTILVTSMGGTLAARNCDDGAEFLISFELNQDRR